MHGLRAEASDKVSKYYIFGNRFKKKKFCDILVCFWKCYFKYNIQKWKYNKKIN
jgi:hypothetical protein